MSSIVTNSLRRSGQDHFEPEATLDPHEQRRLRGYLEQIDFATFAANRDALSQSLGASDVSKFERLAAAAAQARAQWVGAAVSLTQTGRALSADQVDRLALLRAAFFELTEAYEAMRRMVERGYLAYQSKP